MPINVNSNIISDFLGNFSTISNNHKTDSLIHSAIVCCIPHQVNETPKHVYKYWRVYNLLQKEKNSPAYVCAKTFA